MCGYLSPCLASIPRFASVHAHLLSRRLLPRGGYSLHSRQLPPGPAALFGSPQTYFQYPPPLLTFSPATSEGSAALPGTLGLEPPPKILPMPPTIEPMKPEGANSSLPKPLTCSQQGVQCKVRTPSVK